MSENSLALIGMLLLLGGFLLWRSASLRQRISRQDPLKELEQERAERAARPEALVEEMELRLYEYGREVEARVDNTMTVLDQLILDAHQEINRLETLLDKSKTLRGDENDQQAA